MFTICFYQDTRHEKPLFWIKKTLGIGYISHRNDGMTELRINGFERTKQIIGMLYPFLRFKKKQAYYVLRILQSLQKKAKLSDLNKREKKSIANAIFKARQEAYQSGSKRVEKLKDDLRKFVEL